MSRNEFPEDPGDDHFDYRIEADKIEITFEDGFWEGAGLDVSFDRRLERLCSHIRGGIYVLAGINSIKH